jgi:hypothetical protein
MPPGESQLMRALAAVRAFQPSPVWTLIMAVALQLSVALLQTVEDGRATGVRRPPARII